MKCGRLSITQHAMDRYRQRVDPWATAADVEMEFAMSHKAAPDEWLPLRRPYVPKNGEMSINGDVVFVYQDAGQGRFVLLTVMSERYAMKPLAPPKTVFRVDYRDGKWKEMQSFDRPEEAQKMAAVLAKLGKKARIVKATETS